MGEQQTLQQQNGRLVEFKHHVMSTCHVMVKLNHVTT